MEGGALKGESLEEEQGLTRARVSCEGSKENKTSAKALWPQGR